MTKYEQAKNVCVAMLSGATESMNADLIRATVENVNKLFDLSEYELSDLREELEAQYAVFSDQYRILDAEEDKKRIPWIKNAKAEIEWKFWNRYRMLLEQKNYAPDTLNKMDNLTDDILDRLIQPGSNIPFDKRGLIVGHVQSGKTGNYIGLICKAADAGYRLIIVLAGIHNSLRSQTQIRIDEGFLGFDTQQARSITQTTNRIGVGKINPNLVAHSLTTNEINGDFNRRTSEASGINIRSNDPIVLVIKKNASVMKNLLGWLAARAETMSNEKKQIKNLPLLVIDDEADNASINISKNYVSGINACIRSMLKLFDQSAYIGYTATPYANIFVKQYTDEEIENKGLEYSVHNIPLSLGKDIFPKNFIVNIPAPSNYIGPEKIFGIESVEDYDNPVYPLNDLIQPVDDYLNYIKDKHKKDDDKPDELPPSLNKALKYFFLSCAARRARGQENEHNSMLIHVTRFIDWQDKIASLVETQVKIYARQVEFNDNAFLRELEQLWNEEFVPVTKNIISNPIIKDPSIKEMSWADVEIHLHPAVAKIEVRAVHGDTKVDRLEHKNIRPLDYYDSKKGLSVIAVGGNKLSRGLTLEGLTITYFLRASKMYDTLMQMGRWFGYRPGYLDLCRLFTSSELVHWYQHITVATEEMRAEFDRMSDLNKTPADFGLKVRTHPGSLVITAANKFRYKHIMRLNFSSVLEETYTFKKNDPLHLENYNHTLKFINELGFPDRIPNSDPALRNHFIWIKHNNSDKIIEYLDGYKTDQLSFNTELIIRFIEEQQKRNLLINWTVALINNTITKKKTKINNDVEVGLTKRTDSSSKDSYYMINKSHIIDPRHEYIDLTDEQINKALNESIFIARSFDRDVSKIKYPAPLQIKSNRSEKNGLLIIYFLDPQPDDMKPNLSSVPIIGLAISFPEMEDAFSLEYAVNEQFLKEILDYPDELDEEDIDDPLIAETEEKGTEMKSFLLRTMKDKENFNKELSIHFQEGINISYSKQYNPGEIKTVAVPEQTEGSVPLIRAEDIDRYYIKPYPDFQVVNAGEILTKEKSIITPVIYTDQKCTLSEGGFVADSNCLTVQSSELALEYLLALFNSALFAFYNIGRKGEKTEILIREFPVITDIQYTPAMNALVKSILHLQQDQASRENRVISSYFMNVLDIVVFEIYFPEIFKNNRLSVLSELKDLQPFDSDIDQIKSYYQMLNAPQSTVKKAVYAINTVPEFKLIYQTLTNEN
ncbi:TPA: Z1 domain-containing protein [Elizabethkingia anophelis]|nr:Z1 domain-containing protein [Elizabethkingia anophelis]HBN6705171.1 Z1 domain-containing protein [Elizabethkingia anophelis]HBN6709202.1 Z1 domain-containing protein [Elizabethkingia anophelis]HBN6714748.1 Z1 domain-containing protein [Elizabethkingia anophelis]HBN6717527.1 Z1 domain-containing protein [Elizabethkingia anophelis]